MEQLRLFRGSSPVSKTQTVEAPPSLRLNRHERRKLASRLNRKKRRLKRALVRMQKRWEAWLKGKQLEPSPIITETFVND